MSLKKMFLTLFGIQSVLIISMGIMAFHLFLNQEELRKSRDRHFRSWLLADELRQSSDDLTRMARTFVATGNAEYERQYWAVLDIRNGKLPRPENYNRIYWDFVTEQGQEPFEDKAAESLQDLMIREGFTKAEFDKLAEARENSDQLVNVERIAMNAVKGLFDNGTGNFNVKKKPDRDMAIRIMNDEAYHKTKASIMRPIHDFYVMFDQRTTRDLLAIENQSKNLILGDAVLIILMIGTFIFSLCVILKQIRRREQAEAVLRENEEKYRSLIETMMDGVYRSTHAGKFVEVNPAMVNILGYESKDELLSIDIKSQLYFSEKDRESIDLEEMLEEMAIFRLRKKDGSEIWVEDHGRHVLDENGDIMYHEGTLRDITERIDTESRIRRLNETLEQRVAERTHQLETINKELSFHLKEIEQFTYIATHDLQEPLNTLINFTKLIQEEYGGKLDDDGNQYIEFIHNAAGRMRELVKDLLDYSLLGKDSQMITVDCNKIIGEVLVEMDDSIQACQAIITVGEMPTLLGLATELRLLFQNLINNAIKFHKKGFSPAIIISAVSQEKDWLFAIADNGIGIGEKDKEKIFTIFKRMQNRNDYEGTGIGLAHCKKIVELHGGKIWMESNTDGGSTFLFTIPV